MNAMRTFLAALIATAVLAAPAIADYTAGGTFVVKAAGQTVLDNGGAICQGLTGDGVGGGCLPFPGRDGAAGAPGSFIGVKDDVVGDRVAFQVCIDNNGDGICGGEVRLQGSCPDQIFFSHADGGIFHNPLGPLPTSTLRGCDGFQGYVVLLCQGVHEDQRQGPHQHRLTSGTIYAAPDGSGYGDFCGGGGAGSPSGIGNTAAKAYVVE